MRRSALALLLICATAPASAHAQNRRIYQYPDETFPAKIRAAQVGDRRETNYLAHNVYFSEGALHAKSSVQFPVGEEVPLRNEWYTFLGFVVQDGQLMARWNWALRTEIGVPIPFFDPQAQQMYLAWCPIIDPPTVEEFELILPLDITPEMEWWPILAWPF